MRPSGRAHAFRQEVFVSSHVDHGDPHGVGAAAHLDVQNSPEFRELRSSFRRFVFPMTAVFLAWYFLYVIASAWARDFMGHKLVGNINVGLVFGVLQFVSTFLIAFVYSRYMRNRVDPLAERIRERVEGGRR